MSPYPESGGSRSELCLRAQTMLNCMAMALMGACLS